MCSGVCGCGTFIGDLSSEALTFSITIVEDGVHLADCFRGSQHQRAYFDAKVFIENLTAPSYCTTSVPLLYKGGDA